MGQRKENKSLQYVDTCTTEELQHESKLPIEKIARVTGKSAASQTKHPKHNKEHNENGNRSKARHLSAKNKKSISKSNASPSMLQKANLRDFPIIVDKKFDPKLIEAENVGSIQIVKSSNSIKT